jgi:hypothetical protein
MSQWPSTKARNVLLALEKRGWQVKRQTGSHKVLARVGWEDYIFGYWYRVIKARKIYGVRL